MTIKKQLCVNYQTVEISVEIDPAVDDILTTTLMVNTGIADEMTKLLAIKQTFASYEQPRKQYSGGGGYKPKTSYSSQNKKDNSPEYKKQTDEYFRLRKEAKAKGVAEKLPFLDFEKDTLIDLQGKVAMLQVYINNATGVVTPQAPPVTPALPPQPAAPVTPAVTPPAVAQPIIASIPQPATPTIPNVWGS